MSARKNLSIEALLKKRRILITCGTGGVGKTTLSAAVAMRAAMMGKKTVVVTIDPAKRLSTSLGLDSLGDHPTDITPLLKKAGQKVGKEVPGTLEAIIPDTRQTLERFFVGLTTHPTLAQRLVNNPLFQIFAKEFSGTNEYMAMQKLLTLVESGKYDCIILDTPPSRNTLDFLGAPKLLSQFFDAQLIHWLITPSNRIVAAGMKKAISMLERLTGAGFMGHLLDFVGALFEVREAFTSNMKRIIDLMESEQVGFVMVTGPNPDSAAELGHFRQTLREHRFRFDGLLVNRTLQHLEPPTSGTEGTEMTAGIEILRALQAREKLAIEKLSQTLGAERDELLTAPELVRDVHSVEDLAYVAMALEAHA